MYTYMSEEGIRAVVEANEKTGERFDIGFNAGDFEMLVYALECAAGCEEDAGVADWAERQLGCIAESLGVEWI